MPQIFVEDLVKTDTASPSAATVFGEPCVGVVQIAGTAPFTRSTAIR